MAKRKEIVAGHGGGIRGRSSYAIDLRGYGSSDPVDLSRVTMRDYADDVQSLAKAAPAARALVT